MLLLPMPRQGRGAIRQWTVKALIVFIPLANIF